MNEPLWKGRRVAGPADADDLEIAAAMKQFKDHLPEPDAEDAAYGDYIKTRAMDSAAHHLLGVRAAHAAGWDDVARQHAAAYSAAAEKAGFDPSATPPQEILDRLATVPPHAAFKPHRADALWDQKAVEGDSGSQASEK
jgi:hypothetical protein